VEDLSLHILDIAENSIGASAKRIEIKIHEDTQKDLLIIEITDDGRGMDEETRRKALNPFFTTRTTRKVGLGLPLLAEAARACDGGLELRSEPGKGTAVRAVFRHSHPDRQPLGDVYETIRMILIGNPEIELRFEHKKDDSIYHFDTRDRESDD
jgi:signal transduction histidine kinase